MCATKQVFPVFWRQIFSGHLGFENRENSCPWAFQFELTLDSTITFDWILLFFSLLTLILFWISHDESSRDLVNEIHIASLLKFKFMSSICKACHNESHGNLSKLSNNNQLINNNSSSLHISEVTSSPLLSKIQLGLLSWTLRTCCLGVHKPWEVGNFHRYSLLGLIDDKKSNWRVSWDYDDWEGSERCSCLWHRLIP